MIDSSDAVNDAPGGAPAAPIDRLASIHSLSPNPSPNPSPSQRSGTPTRSAEGEAQFGSKATPTKGAGRKSWSEAWARLREPIGQTKRRLLAQRWAELPESLRTPRQVVGRHLTHCGYTMGAAYCSFGCTHCYLPKNANQAPLPTLADMKEQIDANHRLLGDFGALQITGGDVLDAYWKRGRPDELIEIVRYATDRGLVPMIMTHGQILLEKPDYFDRLVREGGLRKVAIHIDMTQAGRAGFPIKSVQCEADLHPLRQQFVELIEGVRKRTGCSISAAHTVTVTERNLDSIEQIVHWLVADVRRLGVFRMLSLQPEADVGRTRYSGTPVTPAGVWQRLCAALDLELPRDSLQFGHPDCSSMTTVMVDCTKGHKINLMPSSSIAHRFSEDLLNVFGGVGSRGSSHLVANAQRVGLLLRNPGFLATTARFIASLRRRYTGVPMPAMALGLARGQVATLNVVMHNFMSADEVAEPRSAIVEDRLTACSFRGAVKQDNGEWVAVPMCGMNSDQREKIYDDQIQRARREDLVSLRPAI